MNYKIAEQNCFFLIVGIIQPGRKLEMVYINTGKYRPKITLNQLKERKASSLMREYNLSERGLQQEIMKHSNDATKAQTQAIYQETYSNKKKGDY